MPVPKMHFLPSFIFSTLFLMHSANAELSSLTDVEQPAFKKNKNVTLHFYSSGVKPECLKNSRHYLIVNDKGYYNSVFTTCSKGKIFYYFSGWDNGKYISFTPSMYKYWAILPEKIEGDSNK
ncbi:hypothetical protein FKD06_25295 [Serratia sp. SRS-8-S-2018]|uniref:hypothetical protein n=1 Tax=Serratia sp. SRS-8-S-2018 TaxID=2591107 RepID=UPI001140164A|nr:hypothetical protein [Serratia sp. SRS-8-S-2018]TPW38728.1 hypothetical protein FKD06_25295 [Serratia sp. SRS-8-S-2018]